MDVIDVEQSLDSLTYIVDTREQPTEAAKARWDKLGNWSRQKLNYGDYSAKCLTPSGELSLANKVVIERKMNLDELCMCFGRERKRFEAEFERAKADNSKVYLLIENASWEMIYMHAYKSKFTPKALIASLTSWMIRFGLVPIMCDSHSSGRLIKEILYREMKHLLEEMEVKEHE